MPHKGLLIALAAALLGGCQSQASLSGPAAEAPPAQTASLSPGPAVADKPAGTDCRARIAHTQSVIDSDVATENLAASVGQRFTDDLDTASVACSAGREGEAMRLLAAAKSRYGYR